MNIGLDEFVEMPAARMEIAHARLIHPHKDRVCFHGKYDVDLCFVLQAIRKPTRRAIGVLRIF